MTIWKGIILYFITVILMLIYVNGVKHRVAATEKLLAQSIKNEEVIKGLAAKMISTVETTNSELIATRKKIGLREVIKVIVTAYSPRIIETDDTPFKTAFMRHVDENTVAISRNILQERGWTAGDKVWIEGVGIKTIGDLMNKRYNDRVDIFYYNTTQARRFGKQERYVALLNF